MKTRSSKRSKREKSVARDSTFSKRSRCRKESPIWDIENVILTPHMSGANRGYMDKACALFADNIRRFVAGQPLLNVVDRQLGY